MDVKNYIEFDLNGRITATCLYSVEMLDANPAERRIAGSATTDLHYVDVRTLEIRNRPAQATTLTNTTLTNLPVPCSIYINGTAYECDSDTAELEFDQPTTYEIRVEAWPYQDWETSYENQA